MVLFFLLILDTLEDTARYAGLLLAPAEGFGLWPRLFLPFGQKKSLICGFGKTFVYPFSIILTFKKNRKISIKKIVEKSQFLSSSLKLKMIISEKRITNMYAY